MQHRLLTSVPTLLFCLSVARAEDPATLESKHKTDRTITIDARVKGSPDDVFRPWSTTDGVKRFVGADARIGYDAGEPYMPSSGRERRIWPR